MRASNTAYSASIGNCQPEFRHLERVSSSTLTATRRLVHADDSERDLQKRITLRLSVKNEGRCNACTAKAHVSDRADNRNIMKPKVRLLQAQPAYDASHCFCPLGSTVDSEPVGRATLRRLFLEELVLINSPIKNITTIIETDDRTTTGERRVRHLQAVVPTAPSTKRSSRIPDPPSLCPMVRLNFTNFTNPMARYYGQKSTLRGGDYLFDQLWSSHGVRVWAMI